ncbi:MAG TPA: MATE family efflux transporter [Acidobacteriaceae bacterium]
MPYWYRRVFALAIPLILSNLTQPLLSTVDTILSGHLPGPAALGGVALGGIFFNAIFWTFGFLRMATTGLVAQSHGANNQEEIQHHFSRALLTAILIGGLILLIQKPLIAVALDLLGATPEVRANALTYCSIRIWSAPASLANYTILGYLLGRQRARSALVLQAIINLVNVAVALFLVLNRHWGIAGIATATLTAEWTGCLIGLAIVAFSGFHFEQAFHARHWPAILDGPSLKRLIALNRDILLRTVSLVAAYALFARTGARAGDQILAANSVLLNFHWIASYGLDGFANAAEALVGESIGAQRRNDYRKLLRACSVSAFAVAMLTALAYWIFGRQIIAIFTNQQPIRDLAAQFLPWMIVTPLVSVWSFLFDGVFIGATRAHDLRNSMLLAFAGFLALDLTLGRFFGNHGLWAAMLGFMILRAGTLYLRLPGVERSAFPANAPPELFPA